MYKKKYFTVGVLLFFLFTGFKGAEYNNQQYPWGKDDKNYKIERLFDEESNTHYYLTYIRHKDKNGKLIKLRHAHAATENGETVKEFAQRMKCTLAFNASTQRKAGSSIRIPSGVQIVDGKIIYDVTSTTYTLGIKNNNELIAYKPGVKAQDILRDGTNNALTAFVPLIEDYQPVADDVLKIRGNFVVKHPRQIIAQFENLDIVFLSCGGRGFDGDGMTAADLIRVLQGLKVKFAYMLDGGGSTSVVVNGELITKKIDKNGTEERPRPNFLYIK